VTKSSFWHTTASFCEMTVKTIQPNCNDSTQTSNSQIHITVNRYVFSLHWQCRTN